MNNHQTSAFPWDVIARLYERLLQQVPGSQEAEITEHAIDLVLNRQEKPSDPEYLFYDVLKNARYSKRRTYQRHYKFFQQFNTLVKNNFYHQTPESYYVSKEIYIYSYWFCNYGYWFKSCSSSRNGIKSDRDYLGNQKPTSL